MSESMIERVIDECARAIERSTMPSGWKHEARDALKQSAYSHTTLRPRLSMILAALSPSSPSDTK